ncbi:hypothetical protein T484DRAFT_1934645 [Baffinella frigidus]|nr:hypothetical protein T484DRAFT_1934645 [Cryptophyta sp. CCMP2293]
MPNADSRSVRISRVSSMGVSASSLACSASITYSSRAASSTPSLTNWACTCAFTLTPCPPRSSCGITFSRATCSSHVRRVPVHTFSTSFSAWRDSPRNSEPSESASGSVSAAVSTEITKSMSGALPSFASISSRNPLRSGHSAAALLATGGGARAAGDAARGIAGAEGGGGRGGVAPGSLKLLACWFPWRESLPGAGAFTGGESLEKAAVESLSGGATYAAQHPKQ